MSKRTVTDALAHAELYRASRYIDLRWPEDLLVLADEVRRLSAQKQVGVVTTMSERTLDDALIQALAVRNGDSVYPEWMSAVRAHDVDLVLLADELLRLRSENERLRDEITQTDQIFKELSEFG